MKFRLIWLLSLLLAVRAAVISRAADLSMAVKARDHNEAKPDQRDWHQGHDDHEDYKDENKNVDVEDGYQIGEGW
ncbi:hypothetical protein BDW62DRAFT_206883 [Aspergillus aurantiobrunneus]